MISELEFRFHGIYQSDLFISFCKNLYKSNYVKDIVSTSYLYDDDYRKIVYNGDDTEFFILKKYTV